MPDFLIIVLAVVLGLGIMILIHEWGHFLAAKFFGVRVEVFSLGFGPRLLGRRRGPTDYRISALPLGGYVKMAGDNPSEERAGAPDEFLSRPRWERALIAVAGPVMNILMAIALICGLFLLGMPQPIYLDKLAEIAGVLKDSPAEKSGIRPGDRVAEINGLKNPTWEAVLFELALASPGSDLSVVLARDRQLIPLAVRAIQARSPCDEFAVLGYPFAPVIVDRVNSGMPAERGGLKPGDEILEMNRQLVNPCEFAPRIQESGGRPIQFLVRRGQQTLRLEVQATYGDPGDGKVRWHIGIGFRPASVKKTYRFSEALNRAAWFNLRLAEQILNVVGQLLQGKISLKQLEGPVGIARQSGEAARRGHVDFINLMAVISLNLGILNLLPIPILDGGHILLLTIEGMLRRDLSLTIKERFVQFGLVFLLVIFAIVMYNDVLKLLPNR